MSELEPPPDGLKDLFAAEKSAPVFDSSIHSVMRARLAAIVGKTPLGHAVAGSVLGGAGKALAIIAITVAAGAGTVVAMKHRRPTETAKPSIALQASAPAASTLASLPTTPAASVTAPSVQAAEPMVAKPGHPSQHVASKTPEQSEPDLLASAWTMLSASEPEQALKLADEDAQLHPNGVLGEEREAVRISALVKLHRMDEARSAASRFIQEYPTSVHRDVVEHALSGDESPKESP
jgi:hypothetical protein